MNRQETVQNIFDCQQWVGNSSISKNDIALILEQLTRKSVHLLKKKEMLIRQKTKVDNDLKQTVNDIKRTTTRMDNIIYNDKQVSISLKKQKSKRYIKGRFWWEGKQREIQIGSEKTISFYLKNLKNKQIIKRIKIEKGKILSWEFIQREKLLIDAIQTIGKIKATAYILKKVNNEDIVQNENSDLNEPKIKRKKKDIETSTPVEKDENINLDWYADWKNENFEDKK